MKFRQRKLRVAAMIHSQWSVNESALVITLLLEHCLEIEWICMSSFLTFVWPQTVHFVIEEKLDSQNQNVISQCARLRAVSFSNLAVKTLGRCLGTFWPLPCRPALFFHPLWRQAPRSLNDSTLRFCFLASLNPGDGQIKMCQCFSHS